MKQNSKKKKQLLAVGAGLAVVAAVSGTFAWTTANDQRINRVAAAAITDGTVNIIEKWSEKPIVANTEAEKEVKVINSGSAPVYVRVSFEEVLKSLAGKGVETNQTIPYVTPATETLTGDVPVNFNGAKYKTDTTYTDVTSKVTIGGAALPQNVKVYAKGSVVTDPSTGTNKTTLETVVFNEYETDKFQAMGGGVKVIAGDTLNSNVSDWTFTLENAAYKVYAGGYKYTSVNWAASTIEGASAEATAAKAALLGSSGVKYGVTYDYTAATIGTLPNPTPATKDTEIPLANDDLKDTQAGRIALENQGIKIRYDKFVSTTTSLTDNTWVYNKEDGYFYYTTSLSGGNQETNLLMNALVFDSTVGKEYINANYDLIVKIEAIQANKAALSDDAGWKMPNTGDSAKIKEKLAASEVK